MNCRKVSVKRSIALILCFALILSAFCTMPTEVQASGNGKAEKIQIVKPEGKKLTLGVGAKFSMKVKTTPVNAAKKNIVYTSSKINVASVSSKGKITAKKKERQKLQHLLKERKK